MRLFFSSSFSVRKSISSSRVREFKSISSLAAAAAGAAGSSLAFSCSWAKKGRAMLRLVGQLLAVVIEVGAIKRELNM